ncbi:TetR/AcrR family transcriptional regulator [Streptomyces sp. ODS28]|uniref:TetR/AcrR family transcriptional regulator n=1 Tax=Streptomyces sp. ODS28 TaxID=3136688 RepID=UPI0031EEAB40
MPRSLSTAEARRGAVLEAGLEVFSHSGYRGTPVAAVATAAGISPAYVFRLFPSKADLFTATVHECFDRILQALRDSVEELPAAGPDEVLAAMADAYASLIADRKLLMLQVHALAASDEPTIRDALRHEQARLTAYVTDRSGAPQPQVQNFFARGQLCHLVVALGIDSVDEPWSANLTQGLVHPPR